MTNNEVPDVESLQKEVNLENLGVTNLKQFIRTIHRLITVEGKQFDLILASGDSGMILGGILEVMFADLNLTRTPILNVPILRYDPTIPFPQCEDEGKFFDNSVLLPTVKEQISEANLKQMKEALFIDDEIYRGTTAKVAIELVLDTIDPSLIGEDINYTIVAEDQGFKGLDMPGIKIDFQPFAEEIEGLNNVLGYSTPPKLVQPIRAHFSEDEITRKNLMNILLDLPNKEIVNGLPEFKYTRNARVESEIDNLPELQREYLSQLQQWIKESI